MSTRRAACILSVSLPAFLPLPDAQGATFRVNPDGSGDFPTIQEAVDVAAEGDDVVLGDGVFRGPGNRDVFILLRSVSIRSVSGDPSACIIECEGSASEPHRGLYFARTGPTPTVLEGITIRGGWRDVAGGLVLSYAPVTVRSCIFDSNVAGVAGGAIFSQYTSPLVENCVIVNNKAAVGFGGAIVCTAGSSLTVRNCTIVGNEASSGSAVAINELASIDIRNSILADNIGGELFWCEGPVTINISCTDIYGNDYGDWTGCLTGMGPYNANFSRDPRFCRAEGADYTLRADSPCAAPGVTGCGLVGALPVGSPCRAIVVPRTWGRTKAGYR